MKTKVTLQRGNFDLTNWLNEEKLGKALERIFPVRLSFMTKLFLIQEHGNVQIIGVIILN